MYFWLNRAPQSGSRRDRCWCYDSEEFLTSFFASLLLDNMLIWVLCYILFSFLINLGFLEMLTEQEQISIRNFYGHQMEQMTDGSIRSFLANRSIGYVALGDDRGLLDVEQQKLPANITSSDSEFIFAYKVNGLPNAIRIKRLNSNIVPESIIESFNRHIWYSRYCLTDIRAVKFDVVGCETFALYIEGYVDDSWDNGILAWEIYESNGDFIGSLISWNGEWRYQERMITSEDQGKSISNPIDKRIVEQSSYSHYS